MAPPKDHVRRETLPWRAPESRTECGRQINAVASTISRAEWREIAREWTALERDYRQARMTIPASIQRPNLCGTCWTKAAQHPTWERQPMAALYRFLDDWTSPWVTAESKPAAEQIAKELWALGRLAQAYPAQFQQLVAEMRDGYRRAATLTY